MEPNKTPAPDVRDRLSPETANWIFDQIQLLNDTWGSMAIHNEPSRTVRIENAIRKRVTALAEQPASSLPAQPSSDRQQLVAERPPEVRTNDDGTLDEVVGRGYFHLEQMSATHWWMAFESGGRRVHVNLHSKATIKANAEGEPA